MCGGGKFFFGWPYTPLSIYRQEKHCVPHQSAATDEGHLRGHDGHELYIGIERKIRHIEDRLTDVFQVETSFGHDRSIRLNDPGSHEFRHLCRRVPNINLATRDIVFTAVERNAFGQPRDGMLRCRVRRRVGPRRVSRDRTVIDDAAAPGILRLHDPDRFLRTQECACQVHIHCCCPLLKREIFHRNRGSARARIVEEKIQTAECLFDFAEKRAHGLRFANVRRYDKRSTIGMLSLRGCLFQFGGTSPRQNNCPSILMQAKPDGASDSAAGPCHKCDLCCRHSTFPSPDPDGTAGLWSEGALQDAPCNRNYRKPNIPYRSDRGSGSARARPEPSAAQSILPNRSVLQEAEQDNNRLRPIARSRYPAAVLL